jgi:hypothetical protein
MNDPAAAGHLHRVNDDLAARATRVKPKRANRDPFDAGRARRVARFFDEAKVSAAAIAASVIMS